MNGRMMIAALALGVAAGCGGSEPSETERAADQIRQGAEQMERSAEQMAEGGAQDFARGLEQMAQGFQQMGQSDVEVIDFEVLKTALPQVDGWAQNNARGEQMSMPIKHSRAEARYTRGDSSVEFEITDSAMNQLLLAPMSMFLSAGFEERSDEGFKRSTTIGGHPALEEWNSGSKRGEVIVVVGNRFIVQATGHDVEDLSAVRALVDAVDLGRIASLN